MRDVRRHRFALIFVAVLVAVLFLPALLKREVFTVRDHTDYFQPLRYFTAIHIRDFVLPHWNPYSASGEPWLANPQTGVFYPPTWLFIAFPFEAAYMLYLALHLTILGWGAYLLFARRVAPEAALAGAVAIVFSGPTLSLLDISNNLAAFSWIPWVIRAALAGRSPAIGGCFLALAFLGGEPYFAAVAAVLYAVVTWNAGARKEWSAGDPAREHVQAGEVARTPRLQRVKSVLLAGAIAAGLSAIQLLPFLEMVRGSDRASGLTAAEIFSESMAPRDWLRLAVPPHLNRAGFDPALSQHFIPIVYVGIPIVLLAVLAWIFVRRKDVVGWTTLLIVSIVVATGSHLPSAALFERSPLTLFRYPSRMVPFAALAIVALAVLAWDRFRPKRRWADLVLVAILLVDLIPRAMPLLATAPFTPAATLYPAEAGRSAKIIRIHDRPIVDRKAWIAGYANLYHRRFDASTAAPVVSRRYLDIHDATLTGRRFDLLSLLSVGFVLSDRYVGPPLQPIAGVRGVTMYVNPAAPPMATFWAGWRPFATAEEAANALLSNVSSDAVPVAGAPPSPSFEPGAAQSTIEALTVGTRHARVVVNAAREGIVMLSQQDAPSWRVYVDGEEKEKLLAGGIFRAVAVPRGRHEVMWEWNPRSLRTGMVITIMTIVTLQGRTFVKRFARRKFSS
ncbi:MAG TPA: 6-pyruvoyl-tetrahydropterin synthase-related protein [Thermoanaerobaculia bacterium]|nr:6-pyruvoyl-tetrahydropterin synthase-related protein [Thermoanaerobaculia bacterium]